MRSQSEPRLAVHRALYPLPFTLYPLPFTPPFPLYLFIIMIKKEIANYFEKIAKSIEQKRLKEAFDVLTYLLSKLQNWQLKERLNDLEDIYKRMLTYLTEGVHDPDREKVFNDLLRSVYQVIDSVELQIKTNLDSSYFFDQRRFYLSNNTTSPDEWIRLLEDVTGKITLLSLLDEEEKTEEWIQTEKQKEEIIRNIFYAVLLSEPWRPDTGKKWSDVLNNQLNPTTLSCLIISALTLNLMEIFDEQKALLLFESAENKNEEIRQRALTGIVLFLRKYDNRLYLYPAINNRLQHLAEAPGFGIQIRQILLQFIFSRETEKISRRITDEIIPEMLKKSPIIKGKFNFDDWFNDTGMEERNPEWQNLIKEAGVEEIMQEISELQQEGADVMHSSFIHLKQYPFFREWSNWFIPFTILSDYLNNEEMKGLAQTLKKSTMVCNSDKYSLFLTVMQMPESSRKMTLEQLSIESDAVQEMLKEESITDSKRINTITRQYIQDLYRFYKAYPRRKDFIDIFELKPEFYQVPSIAQLIDNKEDLTIIGEFYFNKNYFEEAADVFDSLLLNNPDSNELYQKKAYCLQMQGRLEEALEVYLKAELFSSNNPWIIKKLAHCYRLLKQPEEALSYYKKAEQLNPSNLSVQLNIGHCHLELRNYEEALKCYFKVEYLDKNKEKAWRPIAWCSFLIGKYEQAWDYFQKIMETTLNATDYLNAGHTQLAMRNNKEAVRLYGLSLKSPGNSTEKFLESFANDVPELIRAGIKKEDIPFILDRIMYDV
jgi:tetratricopeptide (TPR) repeat protein